MRTFLLFLLLTIGVVVAGCKAAPPPPPPPEYRLTGTIKDIMSSIVMPSAAILWDSVAEVTNATGTQQAAPKTDEDWQNVRHAAISLVESTNLILMEGRKAAAPGSKSENAGIELPPEEIEKRINGDRATFTKLVHALHDAAMVSLKAIDAKSVQGLLDSGAGIDEACENCHLMYWYPKDAAGQPVKDGEPVKSEPQKK